MLNSFCFGSSSTSMEVTVETATSIRVSAETTTPTSIEGEVLPTAKLKIYTLAQLTSATGNFRQDEVLRRGAFGRVFKGWVDVKTLAPAEWGSGVAVAVMRCRSKDMQGFTEMQVAFLTRISHPNVIKLLGYCLKGKEQLLVYEFMQKGNLDTHLSRRKLSIEPISWDTRLKIAIGVARGLNFLHCAEKQIIYRDINLSNILLDGNYNAKISDFGCALYGPTGEEMYVEDLPTGTIGYIAPECLLGKVYVKSDVYSFGAVLLVLLTGLRLRDYFGREEEKRDLIKWAKPLLPYRINLKAIMDVRMQGQYSIDAAFKAAQLTLKCLGDEPHSRPSMTEVVEALEKIDKMKEALNKIQNYVQSDTMNQDSQILNRASHIVR